MTFGFVWRFLTTSSGGLGIPDYECGAGGFYDIVGDRGQLVDFHNPFHLRGKPVDQAKVSASNSGDRFLVAESFHL